MRRSQPVFGCLILSAACLAQPVLAANAAQAASTGSGQGYPNRPIRISVTR